MSSLARSTEPVTDLWRLGVGQYHAMVEAGILTAEDPVELLDGHLVVKMPKKPPHTAATYLVRKALERLVPRGWLVYVQEPVTLEESEPEPDVHVARGGPRQYLTRHPGPADVGLVVEVADTSLARDRGLKKRLYAEAGIPVYWIVNLVSRKLETYAAPVGTDYGKAAELAQDEEAVLILDGTEVGGIAVRDLLP